MSKVQKIMSVLGVDANYLWQDEMQDIGIPTEDDMKELSARLADLPQTLASKLMRPRRSISFSESVSVNRSAAYLPDPDSLLGKFGRLDDHGRRVVEAVLDLELERCEPTSADGE